MDLWPNTFGQLAMDPSSDVASVKRLLRSGSKALFFLAQQRNNLWFNLRLKRRDAVLESLTSGCTPEEISALRNSIVDGSDNLFPDEVVREVSESPRSCGEGGSQESHFFLLWRQETVFSFKELFWIRNDTGCADSGGGESIHGMRYPTRRTSTTHGSTPNYSHCSQ